MSFGLLDIGFKRKTFEDILLSLQDEARTQFGQDVDLSVYAAEGAFLYVMASALDELWQLAEKSYYGAFLETSEGASLDRVVALGGMKRQDEKAALVTVEFSGTDGAVIQVGSIVATSQNVQFETIEEKTIIGGIASVVCRALVTGPDGIVPANSITETVTPIAGVTSLTNPNPSSGGRAREIDAELRARYRERGIAGGSSVPAIEAAIANVPGVSSVIAYENASHLTDSEGRPPNSIEILVIGSATNAEIAQAIFDTKPAGIELVGLVMHILTDDNNQTHTLKWNVPAELPIYVVYQIVANSAWNNAARQEIKTNTVRHIGGVDTVNGESTEYSGIGVGQDVYTWRLEAEQSQIDGMESIEATVGYNEIFSATNIDSIGSPSSGIFRYTISATPTASVGDILFAQNCTDSENNGPFVVVGVGASYVDVRNDQGLIQSGAAGTMQIIEGSTQKADLTSRQVAKTSTYKVGVTL